MTTEKSVVTGTQMSKKRVNGREFVIGTFINCKLQVFQVNEKTVGLTCIAKGQQKRAEKVMRNT
jgi:hypothetical protein